MRWLKREMWKAGIALAGMLLLLVLMVWVPVSAAGTHERTSGLAGPVTVTVQATPTVDATVTTLQKEKLGHDNDWLWNYGAALLSTLVVALAGVFGFLRYLRDQRKEREKQREDRQAEREKRDEEQKRWLEDRQAEREKRDEERFQKVVEGLGSERIEAKVGAAITLRTFLQPGYERFYGQAFDLAVAHLRLRKAEASPPGPPSSTAHVLIVPDGPLRQEQQPPPPAASIPLDSLSQALITVFKESFWRAREELKKVNAQFDPQLLDATDVRLDNAYLAPLINLEGIFMREASLKEAHLNGANLNGANLRRAQLKRAWLSEAQLKGADLSWADLTKKADLTKADLTGANLHGADLSEAILRGAILSKADLRGANLSEADMLGADVSEAKYSPYKMYDRTHEMQPTQWPTQWPQGLGLKGAGSLIRDEACEYK